jgi:hypothetical protein
MEVRSGKSLLTTT